MAKQSTFYLTVSIDDFLASTPRRTVQSLPFPTDENLNVDLRSVVYATGTTVVADAGGVTLDLGLITSASDPDTATEFENILSDVDLISTYTDDQIVMLFRGRTAIAPTKFLQMLIDTDGTITTPSVGAALTFEFEITERSGV